MVQVVVRQGAIAHAPHIHGCKALVTLASLDVEIHELRLVGGRLHDYSTRICFVDVETNVEDLLQQRDTPGAARRLSVTIGRMESSP